MGPSRSEGLSGENITNGSAKVSGDPSSDRARSPSQDSFGNLGAGAFIIRIRFSSGFLEGFDKGSICSEGSVILARTKTATCRSACSDRRLFVVPSTTPTTQFQLRLPDASVQLKVSEAQGT